MAKGRTNQPLRIQVAAQWRDHPAIRELDAKGHDICILGDGCTGATDVDLILHPAAHNWSDVMFYEDEKKDGTKYRPYVDAALAAARARKRGKKK